VRREWEPEDLIEVWTLLEEDQERLRNKSGANRLGFALLLKFFEVDAFSGGCGGGPGGCGAVRGPAGEGAGRGVGRLRLVRAGDQAAPDGGPVGVRVPRCTQEDQVQLAQWLAAELYPVELNRERLAEAVVARCRKDRLEPPAPAKVTRLVASAVNTFEEGFCATTVERLSAASRSRLDDLVADGDGGEGTVGGGRTFFTELKADPARWAWTVS
jgi:hypothetical protein